ncbi:MAG: hypothetical protein QOI07_3994 [Verrucomicrobiota bacterium]
MSHLRLALISAIAACLSASSAFALGDGPAIASDWDEMTVPHSECFARGEAAIQRLGFGEIERTKYSRFGTREGYTIAVRCIEEKRIVLFMASGRDRKQAQSLQLDLHRNYLKAP